MWKRLRKSKVFWTAVAGTLYCMTAAVSGDITWNEAFVGIWAAILSVGFRDTLAKNGS